MNYFTNWTLSEFLKSLILFINTALLPPFPDTSLNKLMTINRKIVRQINRRNLAIVTGWIAQNISSRKKNARSQLDNIVGNISDSETAVDSIWSRDCALLYSRIIESLSFFRRIEMIGIGGKYALEMTHVSHQTIRIQLRLEFLFCRCFYSPIESAHDFHVTLINLSVDIWSDKNKKKITKLWITKSAIEFKLKICNKIK